MILSHLCSIHTLAPSGPFEPLACSAKELYLAMTLLATDCCTWAENRNSMMQGEGSKSSFLFSQRIWEGRYIGVICGIFSVFCEAGSELYSNIRSIGACDVLEGF